jgi:hypothetical protein
VVLPLIQGVLSVAALSHTLHWPSLEDVLPWACVAQSFTIGLMAWFLPEPVALKNFGSSPSSPALASNVRDAIPHSLLNAIEQDVVSLRDRFRDLLIGWMLLYCTLGTIHLAGAHFSHSHLHTVLNLANDACTFLLMRCYIAFGAHRPVLEHGPASMRLHAVPVDPEKERTTQALLIVLGIVVLNVLFTLVAPFRWPQHVEDGQRFFGFASGCFAGVAHALLAGRLSSKALDSSSLGSKARDGWSLGIAFLYLYAVIQPAFVYFLDDLQWVEFVAVTASLLLKSWLFFLVSTLLAGGALRFYFLSARETAEAMPVAFSEFQQRIEASLRQAEEGDGSRRLVPIQDAHSFRHL